jgi:hypothetical protein
MAEPKADPPNAGGDAEQWGSYSLWWGCRWCSWFGRKFDSFYKSNLLSPYGPEIALFVFTKELKICPNRNSHMDVYSSFLCNCQNWEATNQDDLQ